MEYGIDGSVEKVAGLTEEEAKEAEKARKRQQQKRAELSESDDDWFSAVPKDTLLAKRRKVIKTAVGGGGGGGIGRASGSATGAKRSAGPSGVGRFASSKWRGSPHVEGQGQQSEEHQLHRSAPSE